jgi:hypothetical protein
MWKEACFETLCSPRGPRRAAKVISHIRARPQVQVGSFTVRATLLSAKPKLQKEFSHPFCGILGPERPRKQARNVLQRQSSCFYTLKLL